MRCPCSPIGWRGRRRRSGALRRPVRARGDPPLPHARVGRHVYRCTDYAYLRGQRRRALGAEVTRTAAWTTQQEARLLPVPCFLLTFTLPQEFRLALAAHSEAMHAALFAESAGSMQQVAGERRLL